jgi:carbonic anhydrase
MTKVLDDVLAANQSYAEEFGDKGSLAMPPARHFAIARHPQCWWSGQR